MFMKTTCFPSVHVIISLSVVSHVDIIWKRALEEGAGQSASAKIHFQKQLVQSLCNLERSS